MERSKYKVGDYLRLGITKYIYFKVLEVKEDKYVLKRAIPGGKILDGSFGFIDGLDTIIRVSKSEVILNSHTIQKDTGEEI